MARLLFRAGRQRMRAASLFEKLFGGAFDVPIVIPGEPSCETRDPVEKRACSSGSRVFAALWPG